MHREAVRGQWGGRGLKALICKSKHDTLPSPDAANSVKHT
jgi:hypothetical protein